MTYQVWEMVAGKWFMVRTFNILSEAESFKSKISHGSRNKTKIKTIS